MKRSEIKDLTGKKFNMLTGISFVEFFTHKDGTRRSMWLWRCDCGNTVKSLGSSVAFGNRKSCGCQKLKKCQDLLRKKKKPDFIACKTVLYARYKGQAKSRGFCFDIDRKLFESLVVLPCHYCNSPPLGLAGTEWSDDKFPYNGLDRMDSKIGYTPENVVTCCKICNIAKNKMSYIEFIEWINKICLFRTGA